jgi:hypothetical protein
MSITYDIICVKCKKKLWIGQAGIIYTGEPKTMKKLRKFLYKHLNHPLIFTDDNTSYEFMEEGYLPEGYKNEKKDTTI